VSESPRRFGNNETRILAINTIWKCERELGNEVLGIQINVWMMLGVLGDARQARDSSGLLGTLGNDQKASEIRGNE
jgi:hypothetical protein